MKRVLNFLHVSTAYVNSDMAGFIEERIYEKKNIDIEKILLTLNDLKEVEE